MSTTGTDRGREWPPGKAPRRWGRQSLGRVPGICLEKGEGVSKWPSGAILCDNQRALYDLCSPYPQQSQGAIQGRSSCHLPQAVRQPRPTPKDHRGVAGRFPCHFTEIVHEREFPLPQPAPSRRTDLPGAGRAPFQARSSAHPPGTPRRTARGLAARPSRVRQAKGSCESPLKDSGNTSIPTILCHHIFISICAPRRNRHRLVTSLPPPEIPNGR